MMSDSDRNAWLAATQELMVAPLEMSRRLRAAGLPQWPWTSYWIAESPATEPELISVFGQKTSIFPESELDGQLHEVTAAPSAAILEKVLPHEFFLGDGKPLDQREEFFSLEILRTGGGRHVTDREWSAQYVTSLIQPHQDGYRALLTRSGSLSTALCGLVLMTAETIPGYMEALAKLHRSLISSYAEHSGGGQQR